MCCFRFACISLVTDLWGTAIRNCESFFTLIKTLMCILSSFWEPRVVVWFHFELNKAQSLKILRPACLLFSVRELGSNFCSLIFSVCAPIHLLTSIKEESSPSIRSSYFIVSFCTITSHRDILLHLFLRKRWAHCQIKSAVPLYSRTLKQTGCIRWLFCWLHVNHVF